MENELTEAKNLMEQGWKARENLEFDKAETLLTQALEMFKNDKDWFNVTECLNHLAYNKKLIAVHANIAGANLAEEALAIATTRDTKRVSVLRALVSLYSSAGLFELAIKYARECAELYSDGAAKADMISHIATFELRTGNIKAAATNIDTALETLQKEPLDNVHAVTWYTRALLANAVILYNQDKLEESKSYMEQALTLALKHNLKTRIAEIETFKKVF